MDFFVQLKKLFDSFSMGQKAATFLSFLVAAGALTFLTWYIRYDDYVTLYSGLAPEDAGVIVEQLRSERIPYRLKESGTTVQVPSQQVYDLRIKLSMAGLPKGHGVGLELFDKTNLGMTNFMEQVNYQRALQGELSRTISELGPVEQAKVNISFSDSSPFLEDEKGASASVVLTLRSGSTLEKRQVQGIVHLIASSVRGLKAERVTVVDSFGTLLAGGRNPNGLFSTGDEYFDLQKTVEDYLEQKAVSMLNRVIGPDKAVVRISAILDSQVIREQSEMFDPNNVVRSEQVSSEIAQAPTQSSLKNYEISKTLRQVIGSPGSIKKLNISLVVDGVMKEDPAKPGAQTFTPRSEEELKNLEALVKKSVGFNDDREDQIEVQCIAFDREQKQMTEKNIEETQKEVKFDRNMQRGATILSRALVAGAMVGIVFMMLKITRGNGVSVPALNGGTVNPALPTGDLARAIAGVTAQHAALPMAAAPPNEKAAAGNSPEELSKKKDQEEAAAKSAAIRDQIMGLAKDEPQEMAKLLQRTWLKKQG